MNGFSRRLPIHRVAAVVALVAAAGTTGASVASAAPRTAGAGEFHNSVGVVTHSTFLTTPYGRWSQVLARLRELGVRHMRTAIYGEPDPAFRARHLGDLAAAVDAGLKLHLVVGYDCSRTGTTAPCLQAADELPAGSVEALEWPPNRDHFDVEPNWAMRLVAWGRDLYLRAKADPALHSVPVVGPELSSLYGPPTLLGDQSAFMDLGNIHPFTGGLSPTPANIANEVRRIAPVTGSRPLIATEAGFHNALADPAPKQPATDEASAAVYTLRTVLEHFTDGIDRTFLYELADTSEDLRDGDSNYGLLRSDLSPKPSFRALQRLLTFAAAGSPPVIRRLDHAVTGAGADVRELVLDRADGSTLVVLWRTASVWDRRAKRDLTVEPDMVHVQIPAVRGVTVSDPVTGAGPTPTPITDDTVDVALGADPLVLTVDGGRRLGVVPDIDTPFAQSGTPSADAVCRRTVPHVTGLHVKRMLVPGRGRRWVATFRLSRPAKVGVTIDRQRRVGKAHTLRYGRLAAIRSQALRAGSRRIVLTGALSASRFRYRVVLTARDTTGSSSGAGVRYWVRAGGRARGLRTEVGPLVATRCKPVPWISRLRVRRTGGRWVATFRLARTGTVRGFMGRQVRAGPVHRLRFRTVKTFRPTVLRRGSRRLVLGRDLQIVKYRYRLVLTAHDASGNKGVAGLRFKRGAGRTTRR